MPLMPGGGYEPHSSDGDTESDGHGTQPTLTAKQRRVLDEVFEYHPPTPEQAQKDYPALRRAAKNFAAEVMARSPEGPLQTLAVFAISDALMRANRAVAVPKDATEGLAPF